MPLKFTCPRCGKLHRNIDKRLLGVKVQCSCGKVIRLGGKITPSDSNQDVGLTALPGKPSVSVGSKPLRSDKPAAKPRPMNLRTVSNRKKAAGPASGLEQTKPRDPALDELMKIDTVATGVNPKPPRNGEPSGGFKIPDSGLFEILDDDSFEVLNEDSFEVLDD